MARPLRLLSLLAGLGAPPAAPARSCRFASRVAGGAWAGQGRARGDRAPRRSEEMSDGELDLEDVEDKLQALAEEERKRRRTVKYHILRRQMTPPGAPQRKLTWDAIEQIRYLKREQPEEWTVERLAEGFSVAPDVILRVLRSKFVPAPERQAKQDAKVATGLGRQALPSGSRAGQEALKLPGNRTPATLPSGNREDALLPAAAKTLMIRGEDPGSLTRSPAPVPVVPTQFSAGIKKTAPATTGATEEDGPTHSNPTEEDAEEEETWDGRVLTEEQLEELMETEQPAPVVRVGKDFFDAEGNFLYRI